MRWEYQRENWRSTCFYRHYNYNYTKFQIKKFLKPKKIELPWQVNQFRREFLITTADQAIRLTRWLDRKAGLDRGVYTKINGGGIECLNKLWGRLTLNVNS